MNYCADSGRRLCTWAELRQAEDQGYPTDRYWATFTNLIIPYSNVGSGAEVINDGSAWGTCVNAQVFHWDSPDRMYWDGTGDTEARTTVCCD